MIQHRVEHELHCTAAAFWDRLFLDEEHQRACHLEALHFQRFHLVRRERRGESLWRVVEATPPAVPLPPGLGRALACGGAYREVGVCDLDRRRYTARIIAEGLEQALQVELELSVQPSAPGRCRRVCVVRVDARMGLLSGCLEALIVRMVERAYARAAEFGDQWLKTGNAQRPSTAR